MVHRQQEGRGERDVVNLINIGFTEQWYTDSNYRGRGEREVVVNLVSITSGSQNSGTPATARGERDVNLVSITASGSQNSGTPAVRGGEGREMLLLI